MKDIEGNFIAAVTEWHVEPKAKHRGHQPSNGTDFYLGHPDVKEENELLKHGDQFDYHKNLNRENK